MQQSESIGTTEHKKELTNKLLTENKHLNLQLLKEYRNLALITRSIFFVT